jgi:glutamine---fructose-6-phosphate transaminase (isomerizing)
MKHSKVMDYATRQVGKKNNRIHKNIPQAQENDFAHFMLKEINEQSKTLENFLSSRINKKTQKIEFQEGEIPKEVLGRVKDIFIIACGTSYHAGLVGKYIIESLCRIPVNVEVSSEFHYRDPLIGPNTLVIAISQSGETADTLSGVRLARLRGARVLTICNVLGSALTLNSDGTIHTNAGLEVGIAATKTYTTQLAALYLFALYLAKVRKIIPSGKVKKLTKELCKAPKCIEDILKDQKKIATIARRYSNFGVFLYLGRNINYPSALEGALKLKEVSYIPAEGYAGGELKHGPVALIDEHCVAVCIAPQSKVYEKMVSSIREIRLRKGKIIAVVSKGDSLVERLTCERIVLPRINEFFSPLLVVIPLQLLAYHIAAKRGYNVDQPRNLTKAVTVE